MRSRSVTPSSSPPLLWPVLSAVCSPLPSVRWTVLAATPPGDGFSCSVTTFLWKPFHDADVDILEGALTALVGISMWWLIADFPETVTWLTDEEKAFVKARLEDDVGDSGLTDKHTFRDILGVFKDCKFLSPTSLGNS
jgi:hypothetical protein